MPITQQLVDQCQEAKALVKSYVKLPNLGEFIPQPRPERLGDESKYLLELV